MAFSFAPQLAFLAGPLEAISAGRQYFLMSPTFLRYANKCSYGVKMPRLGTTDGKKAVISVPPVKEQKRIIMAIELTFAQLTSIAENLA